MTSGTHVSHRNRALAAKNLDLKIERLQLLWGRLKKRTLTAEELGNVPSSLRAFNSWAVHGLFVANAAETLRGDLVRTSLALELMKKIKEENAAADNKRSPDISEELAIQRAKTLVVEQAYVNSFKLIDDLTKKLDAERRTKKSQADEFRAIKNGLNDEIQSLKDRLQDVTRELAKTKKLRAT
ncbi:MULTISPECIES: hypothetical protein [Herbaspirillum]|uniref:hypothetical protein n=1 Tax=Herbaspirillum TaxID=963 RepID=UPI000C097A2C|nr:MULTISPECIES: hypothetical protein [Herbaspirillum]MAF02015.1 hypothetical protein [Herbaspirillum sp.]|tara:strand:- start:9846 stop:10394 length:549 start_codon:yes stop_codon:yes gene_type:complete